MVPLYRGYHYFGGALEHILIQGCDICLEDNQGRSGVHLAAMWDHPDIIQCLMERGMELDSTDNHGKTPAHYAAKYGSLACLKCLVKSAVDMTTGELASNPRPLLVGRKENLIHTICACTI